MIVATTQTYGEVMSGCCDCLPPTAPAPVRQCNGVSAQLVSSGYTKTGDTTWMRYGTTSTTDSITGVASFQTEGEDPFVYETYSTAASQAFINELSTVWAGNTGANPACFEWESVQTYRCETSGLSSRSVFDRVGDPPEVVKLIEETTSRTDISGTETAEHIQWEIDHPDIEAEIAAWEIAHAAWVTEHAEWQDAHDAWGIEFQAWVNGGYVGEAPDEPIEPEEPIEPTGEPEENYPPCSWKDVIISKIYEDGEVVDTIEQVLFNVGIGTVYPFGAPESGGSTSTTSQAYLSPFTYSSWVSGARSAIEAALNFDEPLCIIGDVCQSSYQVTPEPLATEPTEEDPTPAAPQNNVSMTITMARYRFGLPATNNYAGFDAAHAAWTADDPETRGPEPIEYPYFEAQWDEVFFPAEWEAWDALDDAYQAAQEAHAAWVEAGSEGTAPTIPDDPGPAPTPGPSLVASRSWTYTGGDAFTEWHEIPVPETEGETRVVNLLTKCHRSVQFGVLPTSHGETYPI